MYKRIFIILIALLMPAVILSAAEKGTHLDKIKVKAGCKTCHSASGKYPSADELIR